MNARIISLKFQFSSKVKEILKVRSNNLLYKYYINHSSNLPARDRVGRGGD
jgi:hypothetical protein